MINIDHRLAFLAKTGDFYPNKLPFSHEAFEKLQLNFEKLMHDHDYQAALRYAQLMLINYGIEGFQYYIKARLKIIELQSAGDDEVVQYVINAISLIYFANSLSQRIGKILLPLKKAFLSLSNTKDHAEIESEAQAQCSTYQELYNKGHTSSGAM